MDIDAHSDPDIILFAKHSILNFLTVSWIRLCLDNCSVIRRINFMLCTASDTFRILAYLQLYLLHNIQLYSSIFTIIKADSDILMHD